ncbi:unnamed protein product [Absidia cylindrospora]
MVTFLRNSKLGERYGIDTPQELSTQVSHVGFAFVCAENATPQSCEDRLSHHVNDKASFSGQVKTQFGQCIDFYHDVDHTMKGHRHRSAGVTDSVYIPYENNPSPMVIDLIADQAHDNQHLASDSLSCALTAASLADTSTCCTDAISLPQPFSYSDFDYLPPFAARAAPSGLTPKNECVTKPYFATSYPVLDLLNDSC